ncbi:MAG: protein kinase [Halieaceae bacterium]|nr:protein kinase [Halieaceae bacterium]
MEISGRTVGRYEIGDLIGEGGMAHVYKAYDPHINRTAAFKILKQEHCEDEEHTKRFLKEGKAAGVLTHPNIVTIYDVGSLDNAPYIMMELLEGPTLGDVLDDGEELSPTKIVTIAMQLASALDYAHEKGVVHRDIKPDNIVLTSDGESITIADFGIARVSQADDTETTQAGMMLGTPRYMSPEQASGSEIDGRSDLFAVGAIMYEMVTGRKAFDADSMATLIMQIVQKDPLPIRQVSTETPTGLQRIINKLLQKKPARRFQSGQELYAALERELETLRDTEEEQRGYLPLQIKWTAIMGTFVALAMIASSALVFKVQSAALTRQAIDAGISLTKFIAVQAAIPVLGEDWITLESFVQDASARQTFSYLRVSDHRDIVRSASDLSLVGSPVPKDDSGEIIFTQGAIVVTEIQGEEQGRIFNFNLPVQFRDTVVGGVNLGMDTRELDAALDTTIRMMAALGLAMVLAVSLVIYIFNKLIAKNLLLITNAITLFGRGLLETRISKERSDEFGDLFNAFNTMADVMEPRVQSGSSGDGDEGSNIDTAGHLEVSGIVQGMVTEQTVVKVPDDMTDND